MRESVTINTESGAYVSETMHCWCVLSNTCRQNAKKYFTLSDPIDFHVFLQTGEKERVTLPDLIDFPSIPFQPVLPSGLTDTSLLQIESK
jgi:hypothetical protein